MAAVPAGLDPNDVVPVAGRGQPSLTPVIEELMRTRYCIPHTVLLVEKLEIAPVSRSGRWRAAMLLLGDGRLCIQALLGTGLHALIETGQIAVGAYVRLDDFLLRFHSLDDDAAGKPKKVVYLAIEDLVTVGWNKSYQKAWQAQSKGAGKDLRKKKNQRFKKVRFADMGTAGERIHHGQPPRHEKQPASPKSDDEDDAFEDVRPALEERSLPSRPLMASSTNQSPSTMSHAHSSSTSKSQIVAMPRDWHDLQTPLKLTTLRSIPLLPYAQNWTCNILGIVTSLSEVETSHLPPYRQRIARIADPSTAKRVHLTVFLNPEKFNPNIGSAVLLVGVKNHRFDGGSLKKYASDAVPEQWWFENPQDIGWCDVQGLRDWWADVERSQSS